MSKIASINFKKSVNFQVFHNSTVRPHYAIGGELIANRKGYEALKLKEQIIENAKEAYIKKLGTSITLTPSNISIEEDVLLKKINISSNEYMIALTNALSITIDERYIPKELLERNK